MESAASNSPLADSTEAFAAFVGRFERDCARLYLQHSQLDVVDEERSERLALWDAQEGERYKLYVHTHDVLVAALQAWRDDAAKRAYTQRLMEGYYNTALSGAAVRAEIDARRARLL